MSPSAYINIVHESENYQELQFNLRCTFSQTDMQLNTTNTIQMTSYLATKITKKIIILPFSLFSSLLFFFPLTDLIFLQFFLFNHGPPE